MIFCKLSLSLFGLFLIFAKSICTEDAPYTLTWPIRPACPEPVSNKSCAAYSTDYNNYINFFNLTNSSNYPDANLSAPQLIQKYGFPLETHTITTKDFYQITAYRIPYFANCSSTHKLPVLIVHGLLGAVHDWLLNEKLENLPYILAHACYDVWLLSNRGTTYSQGNLNYTINNPKFWNFSWHEMGKYDVADSIDYIIGKTGFKKVYYVGLSQGGTQYLSGMATNPAYNAKIKLAALLCPAGFMGHVSNPGIQILAQSQPLINGLLYSANGQMAIPGNTAMAKSFLCDINLASWLACANILFLVAGFNPCQMNCERLPVYVAHDPDSAALKSLYHYLQEVKSDHFRRYDNRALTIDFLPILEDLLKPPPQDYDTNLIDPSKVMIFSGSNDQLADTTDIARLVQALNITGQLFGHFKNDFEHLDFYWGIDVKTEVFEPILEAFDSVSPLSDA